MTSVVDLLPRDKRDTQRAMALVALGYPVVEPVLPKMLEWIQDRNWPVARVFEPFLATIGAPLAPHIRVVLSGNDDSWKYSVLDSVILKSPYLVHALQTDLVRLSQQPTLGERTELVDVRAEELLRGA